MKKFLFLIFLLFVGNFAFAQQPKENAWGHELEVYDVQFRTDPLQGCNNTLSFRIRDNVPSVVPEYYYEAGTLNMFKIRIQGPQGPNKAYSLKTHIPHISVGSSGHWIFIPEENAWESQEWMGTRYGTNYQVTLGVEGNIVTDTLVPTTVSLIMNPNAIAPTDPRLFDDPSNNVAVGYTKVATICGGSSNVTNNTIIINSTTQAASTGSAVTLTAQGCTGGTFTWSPAGGTVGGTNNNTYTVSTNTPGAVTYTATCSLGGNGSSTITWQNGVVCAANAGTLN